MNSRRLLIAISYIVIVAGIAVGILVGNLFYALFCASLLVSITLAFIQPQFPLMIFRSVDGLLMLSSYAVITAGIAVGIAINHPSYAVFSTLMLIAVTVIFDRELRLAEMFHDLPTLFTGGAYLIIVLGIAVGIALHNVAYAVFCALLFAGVSLALSRDRFRYPLAFFRSVESLVVIVSYLVIIGGLAVGIQTRSPGYAVFCAFMLIGVSLIYYREELMYPLAILRAFSAALSTAPQPATAPAGGWYSVYSKALDHLRQHEFDAALTECNDSIRLNPNFYGAYHTRALIHLENDQPAGIIDDCSKAVHLNPDFAPSWLLRGITHATNGRPDQAMSDLQQVLKLEAGGRATITAEMQLAQLYTDKGHVDAALKSYDNVLKIDPDHAGAVAARGELQRVAGKYDQAVADFGRAITLAPDDVRHYLSRGHVYFLLGRYDDALADFEEAEGVDPDVNLALAGQAVVYSALGEDDAASSTWEILLATDPLYRNADHLAAEFSPHDPFVAQARKVIAAVQADELE